MDSPIKPVLIVYHWLCCIDKYTKTNLSGNSKYRFIHTDILDEMYYNGKTKLDNIVDPVLLNSLLVNVSLIAEAELNPVVFISSNYLQYFPSVLRHFNDRYDTNFAVVFVTNTDAILHERYSKVKDKFKHEEHFYNVTGSINRMLGFKSLTRSKKVPLEEINT